MNYVDSRPHILLVDDRPENLLALEALLAQPNVEIIKANSGNEALGLMLEYDFAVVLLDVQMPGMDGFEVADLMRTKEKTKLIPIIFVTAISKSDSYIFKAYETGAVDYLFKPLDPVILNGKVNIFLELNRKKREIEASRHRIEIQNKRLQELSAQDGLTGLYNHRHFHELMNREFLLARRNNYDIACFMIDLDYFKDVNDTYGHSFGDFVLRNFAKLIHGVIRQTDILARYGGEEFVLLLPHTDLEGACILAEKFRKVAEDFVYQDNNHQKRVTISIGISTFKAHNPTNPTDLLDFADKALYRAKAEGRNRVKIYNEEIILDSGETINSIIGQEHLYGLQSHLNKILDKTQDSILAALDNLTQNPKLMQEQHQQFNREHNNRSMEILEMMGERLGLPRPVVQTFKRAAKLHDLFKIYLKDETPLKTGPLSMQERLDIDDYPFMLEQLTRMFDIFASERIVLRHHHEHYDGSGYPDGLEGSDVPLGARLFALVDAFVAMTSKRKYLPRLQASEVINELVKQTNHQFDPMLVKHLLELIKEKNLLQVSQHHIDSAIKEIGK
jgi:diguanylate cyclase (GGDEF)-like protein